jgi:LDH2 family malate/lactate/ureidoglycolate dehydrogenase
MASYPTRIVQAPVLRDLMERLLRAAGCTQAHARAAADGFLEADLRGHSIQGLDHMYSTLARIRQGLIKGDAEPRVVKETETCALVDGDRATGHLAGAFAVEVAAAKARQAGAAAIGIVNADDIFMLGYYAEKLAAAGLASLVGTNTYPLRVRPAGGVDPAVGTNPIAIGIPSAGPYPFVLDFATSASAVGLVRIAGYHDGRIPEGVAFGPDGLPTRDASQALRGTLSPLAGAKGFGLAMFAAFLSGPLLGAVAGRGLAKVFQGKPEAGRRGHLILAVDPAAFGDAAAFRRAVGGYLREIKTSRKAPGVDAILVAGERGFARRERSLREGVVVFEKVWKNTGALAKELGVTMPPAGAPPAGAPLPG